MSIDDALFEIKKKIEHTIRTGEVNGVTKSNGLEAKKALICSSGLINYIHEFIKSELVNNGVVNNYIYPPIGETKPEAKVTGLVKQKKQDISVIPGSISPKKEKISWGPLAFSNKYDGYGRDLTEKILSINVRSQLSSLAKNSDTLFERTYAESVNLHELHKKMVLGEVFLIPTHEYDEEVMKDNKVAWKETKTDIEKYISFFSHISDRENESDSSMKYEKCTLLIVDFRKEKPKIYKTIEELKQDGLIEQSCDLNMKNLNIDNFISDLLHIYGERFPIANLKQN